MFSTLAILKSHVLPEPLQASTDYDVALQSIGAGVADLFQKRCNRQFERIAGDTYEVAGDQYVISLPRYPVESIATVELQAGYGGSWSVLTDAIQELHEDSGMLTLCGVQGNYTEKLRITYTGGYWYDSVGGQSQPAGSTALPAELLLAWYTQCNLLWQSMDFQGRSLTEPQWRSRLHEWQLTPECAATLHRLARY